jgi:hypothetical protein
MVGVVGKKGKGEMVGVEGKVKLKEKVRPRKGLLRINESG